MRARCCTLIWSAALLLAGCASFDPAGYRAFQVAAAPAAAWAGQSWHGLPIESGQIIVTEHTGATSLFLALSTADFTPYLHIGVIAIESGRPYVYEAMGALLPMPWARPNAHVGGGVQRVTLDRFLARGGIFAIYDPPAGVDRRVLVEFAATRWRERVPFDGRYDARDSSKYYCVEFVARALEAAGSAPIRATPVTRNPSLQVALQWLDIRTPELLMAGTIVAREQRVALISRGLTVAQIERYFVLKRELHRRFTPDQRLGNVMFWERQKLRLRPRVVEYFETGIRSQTEPGILADRMFGPVPPPDERVATAAP
ncbi:MAG: hypothetical protein ABI821_13920 [Pseudomonadota bacterium]